MYIFYRAFYVLIIMTLANSATLFKAFFLIIVDITNKFENCIGQVDSIFSLSNLYD